MATAAARPPARRGNISFYIGFIVAALIYYLAMTDALVGHRRTKGFSKSRVAITAAEAERLR